MSEWNDDGAGSAVPIVYSKPRCVQCTATYRALDTGGLEAGVDYRVVDISEDDVARDYVISLGHLQAPVVVMPDGSSWAGYRPDRIKAAITQAQSTGVRSISHGSTTLAGPGSTGASGSDPPRDFEQETARAGQVEPSLLDRVRELRANQDAAALAARDDQPAAPAPSRTHQIQERRTS